jgi:amidase
METVVSTLKANGHHLVEWTPYKHQYAFDLVNAIVVSDGGGDVHRDISASGEPVIPNIKNMFNPNLKAIGMLELWDTQLKKWQYQVEYLDKWREMEAKLGKELDAIIAPITATAAIRHDRTRYYGYAATINLLDFTSVIVPVTFADKNIDVKDESRIPMTETDKLVHAECRFLFLLFLFLLLLLFFFGML